MVALPGDRNTERVRRLLSGLLLLRLLLAFIEVFEAVLRLLLDERRTLAPPRLPVRAVLR